MSEKHLKWATSADITIDYSVSPPNISFSKVHEFNVKSVIFITGLSIIFAVGTFIVTSMPSSGQLRFPMALHFSFIVFLFSFAFFISVSLAFMNDRIMRIYLAMKTKSSRREIHLQNPEGTVEYITLRDLLDIEYSEDVRKALSKVTLIQLKRKNWLSTSKNKLTLTFNRRTSGDLVIKEY